MKKPIEGSIVHYVLPDGRHKGEHRGAIVTKVGDRSLVNLSVFGDSSNDGPQYAMGSVWRTSVQFSEGKEPGTWHWIEK